MTLHRIQQFEKMRENCEKCGYEHKMKSSYDEIYIRCLRVIARPGKKERRVGSQVNSARKRIPLRKL